MCLSSPASGDHSEPAARRQLSEGDRRQLGRERLQPAVRLGGLYPVEREVDLVPTLGQQAQSRAVRRQPGVRDDEQDPHGTAAGARSAASDRATSTASSADPAEWSSPKGPSASRRASASSGSSSGRAAEGHGRKPGQNCHVRVRARTVRQSHGTRPPPPPGTPESAASSSSTTSPGMRRGLEPVEGQERLRQVIDPARRNGRLEAERSRAAGPGDGPRGRWRRGTAGSLDQLGVERRRAAPPAPPCARRIRGTRPPTAAARRRSAGPTSSSVDPAAQRRNGIQ